jgi:hypothetical protein
MVTMILNDILRALSIVKSENIWFRNMNS